MATISEIKFKRSKTVGKKPAVASLKEGELAINLVDKKLFTNTGDKIEDLTLRSGGKIDGDVTQVGNYTQTGNFSTTGDISAKTVLASAGVSSNGDIVAERGVIRTRAAASGNAHLWFEGEEVTGENRNKERGVLYATQQTDTDGRVNLRVYNGKAHAANTNNALFVFNGAGDFAAPKDLYGQRSRLSIESVAPTFNGGRLYTRDRTWNQFGTNESYGWNDLVGYTVGQNGALALNYVYKGRAHVTGTIWHHLIDERTGAENAWYTGSGPENKMYSLASRGTKGHGFYSGSLMVGANNYGEYSGLGDSSIALGDNDTGFKWNKDGDISIMSNNQRIVDIYSSASKPFYIKKCTKIVHSDNNSDNLFPPANNALLEIDTSLDGNNAGGNGVTLIGYNSGSKYYHYFRGRGSANFDMDSGVYISKGGLSVGGNISSTGQVQPSNYSNFDSRYQNLLQLGANVNLDTLAGDNHAGEYAQHANANTSLTLNYPEAQAGHLTVTSGAGVQQRYHVYNSTRVYLRAKYSSDSWRPWDRVVTEDYLKTGIPYQFVSKNSDGFRIAYGSYGFFIRNDGGNTYFMLTNSGDQMGTWNGLRPLSINNSNGNVTMSHSLTVGGSSSFGSALTVGNGLTVNGTSGINVTSTADNAISWGNLGACLANDGNLKGSRWKSFGGSEWAGDALSWVHSNNLSLGGGTMAGTLTMNANINMQEVENRGISLGNGSGTGIFQGRDGASNDYANIEIRSWYGVGFKNTQNSGAQFYNKNTIFMNLRNGQIQAYDYVTRSDRAYKENIKLIESASEKISKISGYTYNIKGSSEEIRSVGVIAQEVREVLPDAVSENEDGLLSVNYNAIIATLVQSNKEMQERIKALEKSHF